jgi:hypothetical protein
MNNQVQKAKSAAGAVRVRPMSTQVAEVRQNINLIHETMKATMKDGVHYGEIPGCPKKSLFKPGAEVIMTLFRLCSDPTVEDFSKDGEIRYRVKVQITTRDGVFVGSGIGECSSGEEKYMWRSAICQEEFDSTAENLRRIKFKKNKFVTEGYEKIQQVRVFAADLANTILKMAKKRALIDAVLTSTAASDIFSQDIEDLPEGYVSPEETQAPQGEQPAPAPAPAPGAQAPAGDVISDAQRKRLYAIAMSAGMEKDQFKSWLKDNFGYEHSTDIKRSQYDEICSAAEAYK